MVVCLLVNILEIFYYFAWFKWNHKFEEYFETL
jgi:hypothetical protein